MQILYSFDVSVKFVNLLLIFYVLPQTLILILDLLKTSNFSFKSVTFSC